MGVRLAKVEDLNQVIELGTRIVERSALNAKVYDVQAKQVLRRAINDANMALWVAEKDSAIVGFLFAMKDQHWYSRDKFAADMSFIVDDRHGNYAPILARRFIKWAKSDPKVTDISLGITSGLDADERAGRMYKKLGFSPVGGNYTLLEGDTK